MVNPKIKSEAHRALTSIKSYDLKVFALTVNFALVNLSDLDENEKDKKDKKKDNSKDGVDNETEEECLLKCLQTIKENADNCSVLLITESSCGDSVIIAALSRNPDLKAVDWVSATSQYLPAESTDSTNNSSNKDSEINDSIEVRRIELKPGFSSLKEKENALAASFAYLRKIGLAEDSDSEDETGVFNLESFSLE